MKKIFSKIYHRFSPNFKNQQRTDENVNNKFETLRLQNEELSKQLFEIHRSINDTNNRLDAIQNHMNSRFDNINEKIDDIGSKTNKINPILQTVNSNLLLQKEKEDSKRKKIIFFLIHNIEVFSSVEKLIRKMKIDPYFEVYVASINRRYPSGNDFINEDVISNKLDELGIEHLRFNNPDSYRDLAVLHKLQPDAIFKQSGWDADVPPAFASQNLTFAKLYSIPYEPVPIVNHAFDIDHDSTFFRNINSKFFVLNNQVANLYKKFQPNSFPAVTGNPRIEYIMNEKAGWPLTTENTYRVIWSAHHSIFKEWLNFGVFLYVFTPMLKFAKNHPDIDVVFSPHPGLLGSFDRLSEEDPKMMKKVNKFFKDFKKLNNTFVLENGGYISAMKASDLLIIDGVSLITEYQLTEKPIILFEREDHVPFNELGEKLVSATYKVNYKKYKDIENKILYFRQLSENKQKHELIEKRERKQEIFNAECKCNR